MVIGVKLLKLWLLALNCWFLGYWHYIVEAMVIGIELLKLWLLVLKLWLLAIIC